MASDWKADKADRDDERQSAANDPRPAGHVETSDLPTDAQQADELKFLAGGGAAGAQLRALDWTSSPLGPPKGWPQSLRTAVKLMLNTRHPLSVFWGAEAI